MAQNFDMNEKPLAQLRPASTGIETFIELLGQELILVKQIIVCNISNGNRTFSIYYDIDGIAFDDTNIILKDFPLKGKETFILDEQWLPLNEPNSGFGVQSSVANEIVFTATGFDLELV